MKPFLIVIALLLLGAGCTNPTTSKNLDNLQEMSNFRFDLLTESLRYTDEQIDTLENRLKENEKNLFQLMNAVNELAEAEGYVRWEEESKCTVAWRNEKGEAENKTVPCKEIPGGSAYETDVYFTKDPEKVEFVKKCKSFAIFENNPICHQLAKKLNIDL